MILFSGSSTKRQIYPRFHKKSTWIFIELHTVKTKIWLKRRLKRLSAKLKNFKFSNASLAMRAGCFCTATRLERISTLRLTWENCSRKLRKTQMKSLAIRVATNLFKMIKLMTNGSKREVQATIKCSRRNSIARLHCRSCRDNRK